VGEGEFWPSDSPKTLILSLNPGQFGRSHAQALVLAPKCPAGTDKNHCLRGLRSVQSAFLCSKKAGRIGATFLLDCLLLLQFPRPKMWTLSCLGLFRGDKAILPRMVHPYLPLRIEAMTSSRVVVRAVKILATSCLIVIVGGGTSLVVAREWTDNTGKYHVEAEVVKISGETVLLRKPDGRVITVPIARLNEAGRQMIAAAAQAQAKQSQLKQNRPSLAKILRTQQAAWQATLNTRLAQASAAWNVVSKILDQQTTAMSKWEKGQQPAVLSMGPAEAIQTVANGLKSHRPRVIWDALPLGYQRDLHAVLHAYGAQTDPELWAASRQVLQKSILVMRTQQKFLLNYPIVRAALAESSAGVNLRSATSPSAQTDEQLLASWEATVGVLELLTASDLADLKKLCTLDVGHFLDQTGVEIMQQLASASRLTADDSFNQGLSLASSMQVSQVSMVGSEAVVLLSSGDQSEQNSMVLVEGKWIPAELARAWPGMMSTARAGLAVLADKSFAQRKPEWIHQLQATEKTLDDLLAAQTQAEFDALLDGLLVTPGEE
jgi:hypothetical protein